MFQLVNCQLLQLVLPISNSTFLLKESLWNKSLQRIYSSISKRRALIFLFCFGFCLFLRHTQSNPGNTAQGGFTLYRLRLLSFVVQCKLEEPKPSLLPPWSTHGISVMKGCATPFALLYQGQTERKAQQHWMVGDLAHNRHSVNSPLNRIN